MQVIDRRGTPLTITFGDLNIGDAFQDDDDDICIKTDVGAGIMLLVDDVRERKWRKRMKERWDKK